MEFSIINLNVKYQFRLLLFAWSLLVSLISSNAFAEYNGPAGIGNFGLPGIIDLPTAKKFPDGELILTHQNHKSIFMTGISFQALPRVALSFRYGGQGYGGVWAQGRTNWDRSFDAHISVIEEGKYLPAMSIGLRDFVGTGWYSSEYIVATKNISKAELTAGLGFGRLAGRNSFSNPLGNLTSRFDVRETKKAGYGGTLGTLNWFHGNSSPFFGVNYRAGDRVNLSAEYTPDLMSRESLYLGVESPWNFGVSYKLNNFVSLSTQYLYGSQISLTANIQVNPNRPPLPGGKDLAPVPMRQRDNTTFPLITSNEAVIRKVLAADRFRIHYLSLSEDTANLVVSNTKFRSNSQAIGRIASTFQRFTSDKVKFANISFYSGGLITANYRVDLEKITKQQFSTYSKTDNHTSVRAVDKKVNPFSTNEKKFTWGVGPYVTHRLFNPDLPLSIETGIEVAAGYKLIQGMSISGSIRKSALTNLTKNKRLDSGSALPRVHSEWPLYDIAGQSGHIHELKLSYVKNLAPGLYGRAHAGLLEPFYAGVGGEILYKPAASPIGIGIDAHWVRKRDYDMRFDLLDYETTIGHLNLFYDAGGMFEVEVNAGRYLAGDWGATTKISRKFGSGWEVGGYATLTDVPFETFGEGSFDKAIFVSIPLDWIISSPNQTRRILTLRPITRDGGATLAGARKLYREIEHSQNANFIREFGRLWK